MLVTARIRRDTTWEESAIGLKARAKAQPWRTSVPSGEWNLQKRTGKAGAGSRKPEAGSRKPEG